jgi:hypothetical protein
LEEAVLSLGSVIYMVIEKVFRLLMEMLIMQTMRTIQSWAVAFTQMDRRLATQPTMTT